MSVATRAQWSATPVCAVLLLAAATSCSRPSPPPSAPHPLPFNALRGDHALNEARDFIAIHPRHSGSEGAARAADHIESRLTALGLMPSRDVFAEKTPNGSVTFRNISAELKATPVSQSTPAPLIVLASHYDTKSEISDSFTGANDSGSSTGLLLELARVCAAQPRLASDILFAFLDGEECAKKYGPTDGLHGSRRLAKRLAADASRSVRAVIVLDMIGDRDLNVTIPANSDRKLLQTVLKAAHHTGHRKQFSLWRRAVLDDHVPFLNAGMPAIDLIDFEYGSRPGRNDYWHTENDTLDKLSAESLEAVGQTVLETLNLLTAP